MCPPKNAFRVGLRFGVRSLVSKVGLGCSWRWGLCFGGLGTVLGSKLKVSGWRVGVKVTDRGLQGL